MRAFIAGLSLTLAVPAFAAPRQKSAAVAALQEKHKAERDALKEKHKAERDALRAKEKAHKDEVRARVEAELAKEK